MTYIKVKSFILNIANVLESSELGKVLHLSKTTATGQRMKDKDDWGASVLKLILHTRHK